MSDKSDIEPTDIEPTEAEIEKRRQMIYDTIQSNVRYISPSRGVSIQFGVKPPEPKQDVTSEDEKD